MSLSADERRSISRLTAVVLAMFFLGMFGVVSITKLFSMKGKEAPVIMLPDLNDRMINIAGKDGRVIVLDFWATWCPPCRKQMPVMEKLHRDARLTKHVRFLSVNVDDAAPTRRNAIRQFMRRGRYTMPTVLDTGQASRAYGANSIPTLVIIDAKGKIRHIQSGVHSEQMLRAEIKKALIPQR